MASDTILKIILSNMKETKEAGGYNICLTNAVSFQGELCEGNMVFNHAPSKGLGPSITFKWKAQYRIYGVMGLNLVTRRPIVKTDTIDIEGGQDATLSGDGKASISGSYSDGIPFRIHNQWAMSARVMVEMYDSVDKDFAPIYGGTYAGFALAKGLIRGLNRCPNPPWPTTE